MAPHLGDIERILAVSRCLLFGHNLDIQLPAREIAISYGIEKVASMTLAVLGYDCCSLSIAQALYTLFCAEMELYPHTFPACVYHAEGVRTEAMHMSVRSRNTPVGHYNRHLMQSLRKHCPEIPVALRRAQIGLRVTLDCMVKVRELQRVTKEEDRGIVAHKVPVTLIGVEFHCKAADITLGIGGSALACNC